MTDSTAPSPRIASVTREIARHSRSFAFVAAALCLAGVGAVLALTEWQEMNLTDLARLMLGATVLGGALLAYLLARAGRYRIAHVVLLLALWGSVTGFSAVSGIGLHSSTVFILVPAIVFATLALGPAAGGGFAALVLASLTALYWAEQSAHIAGLQAFQETTTLFNFYLGVVAVCIASLGAAIAFKRGVRRLARHASDEIGAGERLLGDSVATRARQLNTTVRELEETSYALSHDLRAPLRTISGYAAIVASDHAAGLTPEGLRLLLLIPATVARMDRQLSALLELVSPARRTLEIREVNLSALAREAAEELRSANPQRSVRFEIRGALHAQGDAARLREVLRELLDNAMKFTLGTDAAVVEFGAAPTARGDAFFVRDNGAGFDMRFAGQLFRPFVTLHPGAHAAGLAIGLAMARQAVLRHGGEIWAESASGAGAVFYFTLPPAGWRPH